MVGKLKNIVSIQTGLFVSTVPDGDIVYLQVRHFTENGQLDSVLHPNVKSSDSVKRHILQPGDILFAAKGSKNFAAVFEVHEQPCVASTSFFVIRVHGKLIVPAYLAWYLNRSETIQGLKSQAIGSSIVSISKSVLEEVDIVIPDLATQNKILEIARLYHRGKELKQQIDLLHDQQLQFQINKVLK